MTWVRSGSGAGVRLVAAAIVALGAMGLSGCTGEEEPTIPTVEGSPTSPAEAPDQDGQELEFVACMRDQGIADMPDPVPGDTSGRSSVRYALDVMGKGSDPIFQAALTECMALLPELPDPGPPPAADMEALRAFSECMRDNGLTDFPDPQSERPQFLFFQDHDGTGSMPAVTMVDGGAGPETISVNLSDPVASAAWEACAEIFPSSANAWTDQ